MNYNRGGGGMGDRGQIGGLGLCPHRCRKQTYALANFTDCKLHTRMLTDTDLWRGRCSPIDLGITHNVKKTRDPK